jgi:hypothetical protein
MNRGKTPSIGLLAVIFFAALGFRLLYFSAARAGPLGNIDSEEYEDLASKFTEHQAYVGGVGIVGFPVDLQRPPGYPFFLALVRSRFGIGRTSVAVVQCVLDSLFAPLVAMAGALLINDFAGLVAGFVYAADWATIIYAPSTLADSVLADDRTCQSKIVRRQSGCSSSARRVRSLPYFSGSFQRRAVKVPCACGTSALTPRGNRSRTAA